MKALACAAAVIACALASSGCASGVAAHHQFSTDAIQLHEFGYDQLSQPLQNYIRSAITSGPAGGRVTEIDVYGPGSLAALVRAATGDEVVETPQQQNKPFYLIVFHGHFVCGGCSVPMGSKAPEGTIVTRVWSHGAAAAEYGVSNSLPAAVSLLNRLAVIQPS